MTQPLPLGGFQKLNENERDEFIKQGLESFDCKCDTGYWLLIDTKPISPQVARRTDELLLALEKRNIEKGNLSDYCRNILADEGGKFMKKNKKLVGTHYAKKDYLISLPLLQLYLELGLEINKIHTIYNLSKVAT